jgi:hypothetical protein
MEQQALRTKAGNTERKGVGHEDKRDIRRDVCRCHADLQFWSNGAAYFAGDGQFDAWSLSSGEMAYAKGRWWVNYVGEMCIKAAWRTKAGVRAELTCFGHRGDGKVLYQKREPGGDWYVFRSSPGKADDEFRNLEGGNLIAPDLRAAKTEVASGKPSQDATAASRQD